MKNNFQYPYLYLKDIYIPISIILIYIICVSVVGYGILHWWKNKDIQTVKWKGKIKSHLVANSLYIFVLFAVIKIDSYNILHKKACELFEVYRQMDVFLYAWMFISFLMGIRYRNHYTYINTLIRYFTITNYFELFSVVFYERTDILPFCIKVCIGCSIMIINTVLQNLEFCKNEKKAYSSHTKALFNARKKQMDDILNKILTYTDDKQMSIFISDEWGGGKTFFANYLYNQIKETKVHNIIWLNLIDSNPISNEDFIKQVFRKIKIELNSNSFYTGKTSEFENYFETILNVSANNSIIKSLLGKIQISGSDTYTPLTERLEEFSQMLGENKIIIIIDDMDRCTDQTINTALKLFSEIIMLPKSIMVFVGDYKQLLSKPGFENNYFDKYFMYNYSLKTVPYDELFKYYQANMSFEKLDLPVEINLYEEVQTMFQRITKCYVNQEEHGVAENEELELGPVRNVAVQQSIELVKNMKEGIFELEKKLSNPRRVQRISNEVHEKLSTVSKIIKENKEHLDSDSTRSKLQEIVWPAVIFYSFARNLCIDQFWDICTNDFVDFSDKVLETISEMSGQNEDSTIELKIYRLLVFYYFSTRFQNNENRSREFKKIYISDDLRDYFKTTNK